MINTCPNCDGTGKITVYGPGLDKNNKMVYALEMYHPCLDCDESGFVIDNDEEEE